MTPLISICITAYKQPDLLKRTLESIRRQTYKNLEIIVTDDLKAKQQQNRESFWKEKSSVVIERDECYFRPFLSGF